MERLTWHRPSDNEVCPYFLNKDFSVEFFEAFVQKAFEKLARYEDLGYEPEELKVILDHINDDTIWEDLK